MSVKRDSNVYYKTNISVYRLSGFSKIWPDHMTLFAALPRSRHFNQTQQNSFLSLHDKAAKTLSWGHPESCSQAQRSHRITDDVKMCHQCVSDNYYGFSLRSFLVGQFFLTLWLSLATNLKHLSYIFLKRDLGDWEVHITSLDLCYTANSFPELPRVGESPGSEGWLRRPPKCLKWVRSMSSLKWKSRLFFWESLCGV